MDRRTFIKAAEGMERLPGTVLGRHVPDSVAPATLAKKVIAYPHRIMFPASSRLNLVKAYTVTNYSH